MPHEKPYLDIDKYEEKKRLLIQAGEDRAQFVIDTCNNALRASMNCKYDMLKPCHECMNDECVEAYGALQELWNESC